MDIGEFLNGLAPVVTIVSFITFIGIVWWAYNGHRNRAFDEAALLPFDQDEDSPIDALRAGSATQSKRNAS